jgi:hypothetical protein
LPASDSTGFPGDTSSAQALTDRHSRTLEELADREPLLPFQLKASNPDGPVTAADEQTIG